MKKVHVEVWSDFVCPWCWIAKRRFEQAADSLSGQIQMTVTSKSYRLAKNMEPVDFKIALRTKFGNQEGADRMMEAVGESGSAEGLVYNFDTMLFGDTGDAHALVKSIQSPAAAGQLTERLFKAATTDGLNIFDKEVLVALAKEVGVDAKGFDFDSARIRSEIVHDELQANQISNGVPLFLFNGKLYVSGARESAVFQKAILESATEVPAAMDTEEGESCGLHGCMTQSPK